MKRLSRREQKERDGRATQARLSARYAALVETAAQIWELRQAEKRREEIHAIIEELLEDADEDLRAYAERRRSRLRTHIARGKGFLTRRNLS